MDKNIDILREGMLRNRNESRASRGFFASPMWLKYTDGL